MTGPGLHLQAAPRLEEFCRRYEVLPDDVEVVDSGWSKVVFSTGDRVFHFLRAEAAVTELTRELQTLKMLARYGVTHVPRFIDTAAVPEISPLPFGIVSRIRGIPLGTVLPELTIPEFRRVIAQLGRRVASWHSLETDRGGAAASAPGIWRGSLSSRLLDSDTCAAALQRLLADVVACAADWGTTFTLPSERAFETTVYELGRLAGLPPVLVHGDLHEDQVLIDTVTKDVTGILDWSSACLANPMWDLINAADCGLVAWRFHRGFPELRSAMWAAYADERGIDRRDYQPNVFHLLHELHFLCQQSESHVRAMTGEPPAATLRRYGERLCQLMPV